MAENTKLGTLSWIFRQLQKHSFVYSIANSYLWLCFPQSTCPQYGDWKPAAGAATGSSMTARTMVTNTKGKNVYLDCR